MSGQPTGPVKTFMTKDRKDQDGLRKTNCYYCKVEDAERNMVSKSLGKLGTSGDKILICRKCADIIKPKGGLK